MVRIAVTGATGFIGRHLVQHLLAHGFDVTALVRHRPTAGSLAEGARVIALGDVSAWPWFDAVRVLRGHQAVIHLAAAAHRPEINSHFHRNYFHRINVEGTCRVALAAAAAKVPRVVLVSSVHAVATSHPTPLTEHSPCRPTTCYGISKREAELALARTLDKTGTRWTVLRPTPVYGPGQVGQLRTLCDAVVAGHILPIGRIKAQRSLLYVENLTDAVHTTALHPAADNRTYFVSDGTPVTLRQFVETLARVVGKKAKIISVPIPLLWLAGLVTGRLGAVRRLLATLVVDDTPLRTELQWHRPFALEDALARTMEPERVEHWEKRAA